ncbi:hypothetical protein GQ44DRAFT_828984 [Phaeosphaeriaceae sp. PMI808]|nr:hypothetical protein GQ44DRAFT_828984 [Phaeosphaeriaceae sp. PMI808]
MMIFLPLLLLGVAETSFAATCYEGTGKLANIKQAWDLREQVCGHNACANSDAALGSNHYCNLFKYFNKGQSYVQLERNDPSGKFKNCWDAFENIIQQCMNNASGSGFKNDMPNGNWRVGNEWYWIHFNNAATPGAPSGNTGRQYVYGPNKYCRGLSPGGGPPSCVKIPKNCYVIVPLDNVLPDIKCGSPPHN